MYMRFVTVRRDRQDGQLEALKGQHPLLPCRLLSGDFIAGLSAADPPLLACKRKVLDEEEAKVVRSLLSSAATATPHRGPAAGPIRAVWKGYQRVSPYAMDTVTGKHNHVNQKVRSGTVGYLPDGTPTSWTERNNRTLQAVLPHLRKCAEAYRHTLPSAYRCQTSATATRRIGDTPFRILFVNRNFRTALHRGQQRVRVSHGCDDCGRSSRPRLPHPVPGDLGGSGRAARGRVDVPSAPVALQHATGKASRPHVDHLPRLTRLLDAS